MATLQNVSDTARWVAVYRAMETARPDAIFRDPFADRLAGERGHQIMSEMKRGRATAWAMIVRTAVMDEIIMDRVRNGGVDTVLNLAAGLDARAWRLPLPPTLQWFDVDLPAMSAYKADLMKDEKPVCRHETISADLTDEVVRADVFRKVGGVAGKMLVITEGLLVYLDEADVVSLARAIHGMPAARWWLSDIASPLLLKMMARTWGKQLSEGNAPFKFGPPDSAAFFAPLGWKQVTYRSMMDEARRLKREMPMMWLWRIPMLFMPRVRRAAMRTMSGTILLERT